MHVYVYAFIIYTIVRTANKCIELDVLYLRVFIRTQVYVGVRTTIFISTGYQISGLSSWRPALTI